MTTDAEGRVGRVLLVVAIAAATIGNLTLIWWWARPAVQLGTEPVLLNVASALAAVLAVYRRRVGAVAALACWVAADMWSRIAFSSPAGFVTPGFLPMASGLLCLYLVLRESRRRRWPWVLGGASAAVHSAHALAWGELRWFAEGLVNTVGTLAVVVLLAELTRRRLDVTAEARRRAADTERLGAMQAQAAVADERARLARETEDVLGRCIDGMVQQARAARESVRGRDPGVVDTIAAIEAAGRRAITELRRLVRGARETPPGMVACGTALPGLTTPDSAADTTGSSFRGRGRRPRAPQLTALALISWAAVGCMVASVLILPLIPVTSAWTSSGQVPSAPAPGTLETTVELLAALALGLMAVRAVPGAVLAFALLACLEAASAVDAVEPSVFLLPHVAAYVALYTGLRSPDRRRWPWLTASAVLCTADALARSAAGQPQFLGIESPVLSAVLPWVAAAVLAEVTRGRLRRVARLHQHVEDLQRLRSLGLRTAVAAERARMAREMHDVVAHSVMAMVVQAGAARRGATRRPDDALRALNSVVRAGSQALDELHHLTERAIDVTCRAPGSGGTTLATVDGLDDLVAHWPGPARLLVTGDARRPGAAVDLTAHRIVQEALTNVGRHAGPGASALVVVAWGSRELEIVVTDDGSGDEAGNRACCEGYGLLGMAERAALCGGQVVAGPRRDGHGWRVHAILPVPPVIGPSAASGFVEDDLLPLTPALLAG